MAIGIFVCSGSLLVGALAGASLNRFIPEHFKKTLPLIAGLISISMGIFFVNKLHNLPPIALAIIVGTIIGGLLNIEKWIERAGTTLRSPIERIFPAQSSASVGAEDFMNQFIALLILFCASGTGIFGALTEGMTGDPTILLTKSILDFFYCRDFRLHAGVYHHRDLYSPADCFRYPVFRGNLYHGVNQSVDDRRLHRLRRHHYAGDRFPSVRDPCLPYRQYAALANTGDALLRRLAAVYRLRR